MGRCLFALLVLVLPGLGGPEAPHDPDRRIETLNREIAAHPGDGRLYLRRGEAYWQRRDLFLALLDFDRAGELDILPEVDLWRARVYLTMGCGERALDEVDRFLTVAPEHGFARLVRARVLDALGREPEAATAYDLALRLLQPRSPQHFLERARIKAGLGRVEEAIVGLDEGIDELGPTVSLVSPAIRFEVEAGRYGAALQRIDRVLETATRPAPWLQWRAEILGVARRAVDAEIARRAAEDAAAESAEGSAPASPAVYEPAVRTAAGGVLNPGPMPELSASGAGVVRGPYLQCGTPTSAVVRWRTDVATETSIWVGTKLGSLLSFSIRRLTTDHEVSISGLVPDTGYYYAIGDRSGVLAGNDPEHRFTTSPAPGTGKPTRIWVLGDSGTADHRASAVRDAYLASDGAGDTDLVLMLGDNAYPDGTDDQYQAAVFEMYPMVLREVFLWPTLGNHDGVSADSGTESGPYYDIFTLPGLGEAGGLPSGTEAYYSFDYGDIHFICLDSHETDRSVDGAMMTWLKADLADTAARWTIAFWHHPPYTKGTHDSDRELKLVEMRETALPILEQGGVDLVLTGHSHSYERSYLLDGHYGDSGTLTPAMILDAGDGREAGDGAYGKPGGAHHGAVYAVAGSSGQASAGPLDHPAMFISLASLGSLVLDVEGSRLDARFLDDHGAVGDSFTILADPERMLTRDVPRVSLASGGRQTFFLDAGTGNAGRIYQVAGALGTDPGIDVGSVHVPLNLDSWFLVSLQMANSTLYDSTYGSLDNLGRATAAVNVPALDDPMLVGLEFHHAFVVFDSGQVSTASNSVKLTLER